MNVTRILFADDHPLVRAGIRSILEASRDILIVAEFENGKDLLNAINYVEADVLVLDIEMPIMSGIEVVKFLKETNNPIPILILSAYVDELYIKETFALGVSGYLLKSEISHRITEGIKAVATGEKGWISPAIHQVLFKSEERAPAQQNVLTDRELEIMHEIQKGKTNREIANTLIISEHTVKNHLSHIFRKLGIKHRHQAIKHPLP